MIFNDFMSYRQSQAKTTRRMGAIRPEEMLEDFALNIWPDTNTIVLNYDLELVL